MISEWKKIPVADIFSFVRSHAFSRENLTTGLASDDKVGNIHYGDIHSSYKTPSIDLDKMPIPLINDHSFNPPDKDLLVDGDLVMADASEDYEGIGVTVSIHGVNSKRVVGGLHTFVLRDEKGKTNEYYRQYIFRNPVVRNKLQKVANGVSVYGISKTEVSKIILPIPPLTEQIRIVTVLETWDKVIDRLLKKIELKKKIKKGLMQRLLTGKVRLPGFSEKWQTIKLGDVGEIITGNTPPMKDKENYGGQYCWATAEDFNAKYIRDTVIKLSEIGKSCSRFLPAGSILVTCIASIGKNAIAGVPLATNQQINSVVVNDKHNNEFIYYLIENSKNLLIKNAGAGAMQILNKSVFSKLKIKVPKTREEQDAIAKILVTTDDEIRTLNCKLNQLKDQKKYLLNNLITGKIRTPETMSINN